MISADYFRTQFAGDGHQQDTAVRAEVHLTSGVVFEIERVLEVEKGHVVLQVYPPEEGEGAASRKRSRAEVRTGATPTLDRLTVSYESIACVHFSPVERAQARAVGF